MSLLASAKMKNPEAGYAADLFTTAIASALPAVVARNILVITNAGEVNPQACASALEKLVAELVHIELVIGDDAFPRAGAGSGNAAHRSSLPAQRAIMNMSSTDQKQANRCSG
jgi:hypothetical protein